MPTFELPIVRGRKGIFKLAIVDVTGPSSYAAGGFTVNLPIKTIVAYAVKARPMANLIADLDTSGGTPKVVAYQIVSAGSGTPATISEIPAGTDLSGYTFQIWAIGY